MLVKVSSGLGHNEGLSNEIRVQSCEFVLKLTRCHNYKDQHHVIHRQNYKCMCCTNCLIEFGISLGQNCNYLENIQPYDVALVLTCCTIDTRYTPRTCSMARITYDQYYVPIAHLDMTIFCRLITCQICYMGEPYKMPRVSINIYLVQGINFSMLT